MAEQLLKLSPHRDLQSYFFTPSAVAALSKADANGFVVSGKWRQQFDWTVVEWNRDNVFEHPSLRYLPDGDLSGLTLSYVEQRTNCIPIESNLFPTVAWNKFRVWAADATGVETLYYVDIAAHATPVAGTHVPASVTMTLTGSPGVGKRAGLAVLENHYYYTVQAGDGLAEIAAGIAANVNQFAPFHAVSSGRSVQVTWNATGSLADFHNLLGANGNRIGIYGFAEGPAPIWESLSAVFSGGAFPTSYRIEFDFGNLNGTTDTNPMPQPIPTTSVRKMRWTWAADLQAGSFQQTEFQVTVSNWSVSGTGRSYKVRGAGSRRIEDTDPSVDYRSVWNLESGNYSGSRIHWTNTPGANCSVTYSEPAEHELYLGTRLLSPGSQVGVSLDGGAPRTISLDHPGEDVLIRVRLATMGAGTHTAALTNLANEHDASSKFYFDFLEIAYPTTDLPAFSSQSQLALATDWDTYHAQSLPAERTAWIVNQLGFKGRLNHYVGALWFYELVRTGTVYASAAVTLTLNPDAANRTAILAVGTEGQPLTTLTHLILPDDTAESVTVAFANQINLGSNLLWAQANGNQLLLTARAMGAQGDSVVVTLDPASAGCQLSPGSTFLSGGLDGAAYGLDPGDPLNQTLISTAAFWRTDLTATPRINRAARDWHQAYFVALKNYGIDVVAAFSTEILNGDPSLEVGIAQRYPDGSPVVVNTPAVQTNFSPASLNFWKQVYLDMATLQANAGVVPYLQSGEVQWWYFPKPNVGMTFYDEYTKAQFRAIYGKELQVIVDNVSPNVSLYVNEIAFLPTLIGEYTRAIRTALKDSFGDCRFEVLYPPDTNDTLLNRLINFPNEDWTPANLDCLKTESFTFTSNRDLDKSLYSMSVSALKGFRNTKRSHLIGIGDAWTAWIKEADLAQSEGMESVVLFALDQFCLIGYANPPVIQSNRSRRLA